MAIKLSLKVGRPAHFLKLFFEIVFRRIDYTLDNL